MVEKDKKTLLQEKYVELQLVSMQIKQLEEQLAVLDQRAMEMVRLRDSLQKLGDFKANANALAPISPGFFVNSTIDATKGVLVNVGAGIIVRKTIAAAQETVAGQLKQLENITVELSTNLRTLAEYSQQAEAEINNLVG